MSPGWAWCCCTPMGTHPIPSPAMSRCSGAVPGERPMCAQRRCSLPPVAAAPGRGGVVTEGQEGRRCACSLQKTARPLFFKGSAVLSTTLCWEGRAGAAPRLFRHALPLTPSAGGRPVPGPRPQGGELLSGSRRNADAQLCPLPAGAAPGPPRPTAALQQPGQRSPTLRCPIAHRQTGCSRSGGLSGAVPLPTAFPMALCCCRWRGVLFLRSFSLITALVSFLRKRPCCWRNPLCCHFGSIRVWFHFLLA